MKTFPANPCALCRVHIEGYGHNGQPLINGRVCTSCNQQSVIPYRLFSFLHRGDKE